MAERNTTFEVKSADPKTWKPLSLEVLKELKREMVDNTLIINAVGKEKIEGLKKVLAALARWIEIINVRSGKRDTVCYCTTTFKRAKLFA